MVTVSLCLIVKNEESTLQRCLNSVKEIVDEIVIVDTGSTDRTIEIAAQFTNKVLEFSWEDDFSKARNFSFQQATKDYILWLDADDVLNEKDVKKFLELKKTLSSQIDAVAMDYYLDFDEYGNVAGKIKKYRLVRRMAGFKWIGSVHEYLDVEGKVEISNISIIHKSERHSKDRNLRIYKDKLAKGETFEARDLYYFANELKENGMYDKAIFYFNKFLNTGEGWIEDKISACSKLADCYFEKGEHDKEYTAILTSFIYDIPRPEFCCRLGYYFLERNELRNAIYWYYVAIQLEISNECSGFVNPAFSTWLPHLQLCVCYDRLQQYDLAYQHNESARKFRSEDPQILHNKQYLEVMKDRNLTSLGETYVGI